MNGYHHHLTKLSEPMLKDLLRRDEFKNLYTTYCTNYGVSDKIVKELVTINPLFENLLSQMGLLSSNQLSLQSHLIKPVQRLCKYKLLMEAYLKNTL